MYRLLVKTHAVTGLKYLCKTVKKDYLSYKGSGKYWRQHLKKYGPDIKTELLYETECLVEFNRVCLEYSSKYNVAESDEWANLIPENGMDGGNRWESLDKERQEQVRMLQRKRYKDISRPIEHCKAISDGRRNMSNEDKEKRKLRLLETRSVKNYDHLWTKMSNERKGGANPAAKSVEIEGILYRSIAEAAEALGLPRYKVDYRLKSDMFPTYRRI
jgi:hypothetical protein